MSMSLNDLEDIHDHHEKSHMCKEELLGPGFNCCEDWDVNNDL